MQVQREEPKGEKERQVWCRRVGNADAAEETRYLTFDFAPRRNVDVNFSPCVLFPSGSETLTRSGALKKPQGPGHPDTAGRRTVIHIALSLRSKNIIDSEFYVSASYFEQKAEVETKFLSRSVSPSLHLCCRSRFGRLTVLLTKSLCQCGFQIGSATATQRCQTSKSGVCKDNEFK